MQLALQQAQLAAEKNEVPVGAVLVSANNSLLAAAHNQPVAHHDPTAHAEILVLRKAGEKKRNYRLPGTTLYVTLEPCVMCVGAMMHARISRLVYGAAEYKTGAIESACRLLEQTRFNHQLVIESGIMNNQCAEVMSDFFARRRNEKKLMKNTRDA